MEKAGSLWPGGPYRAETVPPIFGPYEIQVLGVRHNGPMSLESLQAALQRGAPILGEILGVGMSADAHHITAPEPEGAGASRAMREAVERAGITPADIVHINAEFWNRVSDHDSLLVRLTLGGDDDAGRVESQFARDLIDRLAGFIHRLRENALVGQLCVSHVG